MRKEIAIKDKLEPKVSYNLNEVIINSHFDLLVATISYNTAQDSPGNNLFLGMPQPPPPIFPFTEPFVNQYCDLAWNTLTLNLDTVNKQRKPLSLNSVKALYKYVEYSISW